MLVCYKTAFLNTLDNKKDIFRSNYMSFLRTDNKAVSPIVATLVLIVVAIIGAAAVGVMLGAFSTDVSNQANSGKTNDAASTELLIGGSTTVWPLTEELAVAYQATHQGIRINNQAGGSGAGRTGAENGVLDIGACSDDIKTYQAAGQFTDLVQTEIGYSAVVMIASPSFAKDNVVAADVQTAYKNSTDGTVAVTAGNLTAGDTLYQRGEISGTEDCFAKYIGFQDSTTKQFPETCKAKTATGNANLYSAVVSSTGKAVGFCDYGFVTDKTRLVGLDTVKANVTDANIKQAIKDAKAGNTYTTPFPTKLTRTLYYVTKGSPNTNSQSFIDFAKKPDSAQYFANVGYYSLYDI
jgi:phosphate transport system substrate-binding protein